jgi:hypothetical protein
MRSVAEQVAAQGGWGRRQGYQALVLEVVRDGTPKPWIPDALFNAPALDDDPPPPFPTRVRRPTRGRRSVPPPEEDDDDDLPPPPLPRHRARPGARLVPCPGPVPGDAPADTDADDRPPDPDAPLRQLLRALLPGVDLGRV